MIEHLTIENFRNVTKAEMPPGRLNIVVGPAGGGKTSIVEAIRYALTGRDQWTDDRGCGLETQVKAGEKKATISLRWAGDGTPFVRTIPPPKGVTALQQTIDGVLKVPLQVVAAQMETRRIFHLAANHQQALIQQVAGAHVTIEQVLAEMDKLQAGLGKWFDAKLDKVPAGTRLFDFAQEGRRDAKKARDKTAGELEVKAKAVASAETPPTQEHLDFLERKISELATQIGRAEGEGAGARELAESRMREYTTRMQQHDQAVAGLNAAKHAVKVAQADVDGMAHPERGSDAIETDLSAAIDRRNAARGEEDAALKAMSAIPDGPCPAGACLRASTANALEKVNAAKKAADEADLVVLDLRRQHAAAERLEEAIANALGRLDNAKSALATAKKAIDALPVPPPKPEPAPAGPDLSALREQKSKTELALVTARAAQMRAQAAERVRGEVTKLETDLATQAREAELWELVVPALGPAGIKAKLMEAGIQEFAGDADQLCVEHFGARLRIVPEPWAIEMNFDHGWIPVGQASWSWQARASACIQVALARRSGFPIVVLDETGSDPPTAQRILGMLDEQDELQVFLLSTARTMDGDAFVRLEAAPGDWEAGWRWFWVQDGRVEMVERVAEEVVR